jgi:hypothetical protein
MVMVGILGMIVPELGSKGKRALEKNNTLNNLGGKSHE